MPAFEGRGGLVAAMVVDSVGTGLFLPFVIVYFLNTTSLPLAAIGASLSAAALAALPTPIPVGALIDRFGAQRLVGAGNLFSGAAFVAYLFVGSIWQLVPAAFLASVGQATFWTATRAFVGVIARPSERATWFALQTTTRNAGYGLGGILGALLVSAGSRWGYFLLAAVNAASYLLAAGLVLRWQAPNGPPPSPDASPLEVKDAAGPQPTRLDTYRALLKDRGLLLASGVNLVFVLCTSVLSVLLAVYLTTALDAPVWLSGALFTLNTVLIVLAQNATTRRVTRRSRPNVLIASAGSFAAAFVLLWVLSSTPRSLVVPGVILAILVFTMAEMLQGPLINTLIVDMAPAHAPGRYLATYQLSWSLGAVAAPGLLTWLLTLDTALPWITLIALCALATAAIHLMPIAHPQATPHGH